MGENLRYLVRDRHGRPVACALFGSAAWKCADRDAFLGWDRATRERNLQRLTNNTRFLIPGWVEVPHLASHVLGLIARRIRADWQAKYGHPVHALETFVDRRVSREPATGRPAGPSGAHAAYGGEARPHPAPSSRTLFGLRSILGRTRTGPRMDAAGILSEYRGRAVRDFWKSYFDYGCEHALCKSHLLRELVFLWEEQNQQWAKAMIDHLLAIKAPSLAPARALWSAARWDGSPGLAPWPFRASARSLLPDPSSPR